MSESKLPKTFGGLRRRLEADLDWALRRDAIYAIAEHGVKALPILVDILLRDPDWGYRACAAEALIEMGVQSKPYLLQSLKEDSNEVVQCWSATALGDLGDKSVLPVLWSQFRSCDSDFSKAGIAYAIRELGDRDGFKELILLLRSGDEHVRIAVAQAVKDLSSKLDALEKRKIARELRSMLKVVETRAAKSILSKALDAVTRGTNDDEEGV